MSLTIEQIDALTTDEVTPAYETAKRVLDGLLAKVEKDSSKKVELQKEIQTARLVYVLLRGRKYPKHFANKVQVASLLPAKALAA
jgi:hypothetical protein